MCAYVRLRVSWREERINISATLIKKNKHKKWCISVTTNLHTQIYTHTRARASELKQNEFFNKFLNPFPASPPSLPPPQIGNFLFWNCLTSCLGMVRPCVRQATKYLLHLLYSSKKATRQIGDVVLKPPRARSMSWHFWVPKIRLRHNVFITIFSFYWTFVHSPFQAPAGVIRTLLWAFKAASAPAFE